MKELDHRSALDYSNWVHQASGMLSVQAHCTVGEALTWLTERAEATGQTLEEIATEVLERRLRFSA
jgi:AmiR/NasT family two-component response regulator